MEFLELLQQLFDLINWWKNRSTEVEGAGSLMKSAAWNDADASSLQQLQTIEHVGLDAQALGVIDGALWQSDLRERVHGALDRVAFDALDRVEELGDQLSLLFETLEDVGLLLDEELVGWLAWLGRVDDGVHAGLAEH